MGYVGRFAPSPTGALHIGSLLTAVASFLDARRANGEWLVRIDDIDPPREVPGAADEILRALDALDLQWDRSVFYQSNRLEAYRTAADNLLEQGLAFRCVCSRKTLRTRDIPPRPYPGICRRKEIRRPQTAIRLRVEDTGDDHFVDGLQGPVSANVHESLGDYVVYRRGGLPAYHLAVVLDDGVLGVTDIVRGVDLLESTFAHRHLQRTLGLETPRYCHVPVLVNAAGQKLSKRTGAEPLDLSRTSELASTTLRLLGLEPPKDLMNASASTLWAWARNHWALTSLKGRNRIEL